MLQTLPALQGRRAEYLSPLQSTTNRSQHACQLNQANLLAYARFSDPERPLTQP